jgi:Zn-dependent protease with chaperone function
MRAAVPLRACLAAALPPSAAQAATAEALARVQARLQQAAAPWCERLAEPAADGSKRCAIELQSIPGDRPRAFAQQGNVVVSEPMLALLTEDELALVGGHEMAHLLLGHPPPGDAAATDRKQLEMDADRLGFFLAGLAGYPVRQLAAGWPALVARLTSRPPNGNDSHPASEVRVRAVNEAASEFCTRGERHEPLMPALERLQPRDPAAVKALQQRAAQLPLPTLCRPPASP